MIDIRAAGRYRVLEQPLTVGIENGNVETIVRTKRREHGSDKIGLRLSIRLVHRAGRIAKQKQFQRLTVRQHLTLPVALGGRRHELDHEIPIITSPMGDRHDIGRSLVDVAHEFEVAFWRILLGRKLNRGRPLGPLDTYGMRWRVDVLQRQRRVDKHVDRQFAERSLLQHLASQGIRIAVLIRPQRQHLSVDDLDPFFRMCLDRKYASLKDIAAGPFKQTGVAAFAEDCFVDFTRPLFLDNIRLHQLASDPHAKTANRSVLR